MTSAGIPSQDVGAGLSVVRALEAQTLTVGGTNGVGVDRNTPGESQQFLSGVLIVDASSTSSAFTTLDAVMEHSVDNSVWANLNDADGNQVAITQISSADTVETVNFNLLGARRFIRAVFTEVGTSIDASACIVLGGAARAGS